MSNLTNIITAIRTKDYASANEGVSQLLQQKMADRLAQERRTLGESLLREYSVVIGGAPTLPANWKDGFDYPYAIGAGGSETPFLRGNQWYLRVYNTLERKHYLYNFQNDMFELDEDYNPAREGEQAAKLDDAIRAALRRGDKSAAQELIKRANDNGRKLKLSDFNETYAGIGLSKTPHAPEKVGMDAFDAFAKIAHPGGVPPLKLKEQALPKSEIQRVFDEIGDVGETKLLCGLTHLQVNNGSVEDYRFVVVEASGMNIHGVPFIPSTPSPSRVIVDYWTWNAYEGSMNGIRYFSTRAEAEAWVKESKAAAVARKENFDATIKGR
jgi:hypothetical protein